MHCSCTSSSLTLRVTMLRQRQCLFRILLADGDELVFHGEEGVDDVGIEVRAGILQEDRARDRMLEGGLIAPLGSERVVDVGYRHDSPAQRNLFSAQALRIA